MRSIEIVVTLYCNEDTDPKTDARLIAGEIDYLLDRIDYIPGVERWSVDTGKTEESPQQN